MKSTPDLCDAYEAGMSVLEPLFTNFGGREPLVKSLKSNVSKTTPK
jgi:hypothetical protein